MTECLQEASDTDLSSSDDEDMVDILAIPPDEVRLIWNVVAPMLERATNTTKKVNIEDARRLCDEGYGQLWIAYCPVDSELLGAVVSELRTYPSGFKTGIATLCGGTDFKRWCLPLCERIEAWCIAEGCDAAEVIGRKGWGKMLPDYELIEYVYSKEL